MLFAPHGSLAVSLKYVAWVMIGATLGFYLTQQVLVYAGGVLLSLFAFVSYHRSRWQIFGWWGGVANLLTALRGLLLVGLLAGHRILPPYAFLGVGIVTLVLDGLDGYYARKFRTVSVFGDVFDKEVDALFVLTFGVLIVDWNLAGSWVMLPGLLRYGYVIGLSLLDRRPSPSGKSFRRQFVGMWLMGTLLAPFALPTVVYYPGLLFATVIVTISFVVDFYQTLRSQPAEAEA